MISPLTTSVPTESSQQLLEGLQNQFLQISRLISGYLTAFDNFPTLPLKSWVMVLMNYRPIQRICIYGFQMTHCNYFNDLLTLYVRTLVRTSVVSRHYWVLWYFLAISHTVLWLLTRPSWRIRQRFRLLCKSEAISVLPFCAGDVIWNQCLPRLGLLPSIFWPVLYPILFWGENQKRATISKVIY